MDLAKKEGKQLTQSTLRKKIAEALEGESLDLREISKLFGIKEKEVLDHLNHIEKSAHRGFTVEPASCQQCGFSFKKRTRLSTPGRCPVCKSEHIPPPRFKITMISILKQRCRTERGKGIFLKTMG
jgi:predicted Zn-ribbon and HTH transcriptional regulator